MVLYNWKELENKCPIKLSKLREHINIIEEAIQMEINEGNITKIRDNLIDAKSELEIILKQILMLLYDPDILKTSTDKGFYMILKDDVSGYLGIIDEKQAMLLEKFDNLKEGINSSKVSVFRGVLKESLYGVIWNSLDFSSAEYNKIDDKEKNLSAFLRILFLVMSINMGISGGVSRRKIMGLAGGIGGITGKMMLPPSYKMLFSEKAGEQVKKEYKERYGEELPEDEFEIIEGGEDIDNIDMGEHYET